MKFWLHSYNKSLVGKDFPTRVVPNEIRFR
jgi:hypothetical protein